MRRRDRGTFGGVLRCLAFALAIPLTTVSSYAEIAGTVSDSSGLPIAGAEVVFSCPDKTWSGKTDSRGRFQYPANAQSGTDCSLAVNQKGFEPFQQTLRSDQSVVAVRLAIATLREVVRVEERLGEDPLVRTTISSISLSDAELVKVSNDTGELIRYAKLLAGAMARDDVIQVDGLPSQTLPPAEMISRIVVNANPFSAQYGEGNANFIDIVTKAPDRKFRFSLGGSPPGAGAHDAIMPGIRSDSRSFSLRIRGPVPHSPLTFSFRGSAARNVNNVPVVAVLPAGSEITSPEVRSASRSGSGQLDVYYSRESLQGTFSYSESRGTGSNQGSGGLTLPGAGFNTSSVVRSTRISVNRTGEHFLIRSGLVAGQRTSDLHANSEELGVSVIGAFVNGGAPVSRSQSDRIDWSWTTVLQPNSQNPSWMIGFPLARSSATANKVPNRTGLVQFESLQAYTDALAGARTGTWFLTSGNGNVRNALLTAGPYIQGTLRSSAHLLIMGGVRLEYQSGFGALLSPRLTLATERKGFVLRTGGGLFVRDISDDMLLRVLSAGSGHLRQFIVPNASFTDTLGHPAGADTALHSALASDLTRMREFMAKSSIERPLGRWSPGLEYTWTRDRHALGSRRTATGQGWLDVVESDSAAERHELHARLGRTWKTRSLVAHYTWIHSRDDSDSPFSFREQQNDLLAEWARSAGVSPHNVSLVGSLRLPAAIALSLTYSYRSSAPYNITTGLDPAGLTLYNDRGGRARNSGDGPGQNSLSLYFSRRLSVPMSDGRVHMNLGIQADNVLGNRNYIGVGSVVNSPVFGKPIAAYPGPALRLWFNLD